MVVCDEVREIIFEGELVENSDEEGEWLYDEIEEDLLVESSFEDFEADDQMVLDTEVRE